MKILINILLIIWGLPQNILGSIIWFICKVCKKNNTDNYRGKVIVFWNLKSGLSLGSFIFVNPIAGENTKNHEYGHTIQSNFLGPLFLIVIGLPSIIWAGCFDSYRRKHNISYYQFYTEKWADALGGVKRT